ncbi:fumarylacetoacetase [Methylobacterium aquaticum]|uniref:fumarylacetoacetase n=1 Tax=Methylobacterium aquaticum TaxID=270351 RepID=UPI003D1666B7
MRAQIDDTHALDLRSWVASADGHSDFPIQNLPFGIVSVDGGERRAAVAIGDQVIDLAAARATDLFADVAEAAVRVMAGGELNAFLALGAAPRRALRARLSEILRVGAPERARLEPLLLDRSACTVHLPTRIGDYTDFFVGIHHALNVGKQFRPDAPLMPNYKWVPIGYHGRASSVVPSGTAVRRPRGQIKSADFDAPSFIPSRRLDFELELGVWIGPGNDLGTPIPIAEAADHIAGFCLLNDWSARDIQAWEYQPLGPFLAKNFSTTVSPWIVTPEALAPFRVAQPTRPDDDPMPLSYLADADDQAAGGLAIELEVLLETPALAAAGLPPHALSRSDARHMYWTVAQLVAHHTSCGCNLNPGDLFGTGTISGPDLTSAGSLLEASLSGKQPIRLRNGEERSFLEDGDQVILKARCTREGAAPIGFGECQGRITSTN